MEPKPRGLPIEPSDPDWLKTAKKYFVEHSLAHARRDTSLLRTSTTIDILDRYVLPNLDHSPAMVVVGLGFDDVPVPCSWTPYIVAAHLEGMGLDYSMRLVDIDPDIIDGMRKREEILFGIPRSDFNDRCEELRANYLRDTQQAPRMVAPEHFPPNSQMVLYDGLFAARIPNSFRSKLQIGQISLVTADIAIADLGDPESVDYAECLNVFYQLNENGKRLAIVNLARALREGGYLIVNDRGGVTRWFAEDLHLQVVEEWWDEPAPYDEDLSPPTETVVFKKNAA